MAKAKEESAAADAPEEATAYEKVMTAQVPAQPTVTRSETTIDPELGRVTNPIAVPRRPASNPIVPTWFWIGAVCLALVAGVVGFMIGEHTTKGTVASRFGANSSSTTNGGFGGAGGFGGGMGMRRGTRGTVTAVSSSSITVNDTTANSTTTFTVTSSTKVLKSNDSTGSMSDVKVGDSVLIRVDSSSSSSSQETAATIMDMGTASSSSDGTSANPTSSDSSSSSSSSTSTD